MPESLNKIQDVWKRYPLPPHVIHLIFLISGYGIRYGKIFWKAFWFL